jgi:hypothetical protein
MIIIVKYIFRKGNYEAASHRHRKLTIWVSLRTHQRAPSIVHHDAVDRLKESDQNSVKSFTAIGPCARQI